MPRPKSPPEGKEAFASPSHNGAPRSRPSKRPRKFPFVSFEGPRPPNLDADGEGRPPHFNSTLEKIVTWTQSHNSYPVPGTTTVLSDLGKVDSISKYEISEEQEKQLQKIEVERLLRAVREDQSTHTSPNIGDYLGSDLSLETFCNLSFVADQLLCALDLCYLDNQLVLIEHYIELVQSRNFSMVRKRLARRFGRSSGVISAALNNANMPKRLKRSNNEAIFALVDYTTACIARHALCSSDLEYWHTRFVGSLAKVSAKVKVLVLDLSRTMQQGLEDADDLLAKEEAFSYFGLSKKETAFHVDLQDFQPDSFRSQGGRASRLAELQGALGDDDSQGLYYADTVLISDWANILMRNVLWGMKGSTLHGLSLAAFDVCALAYKTGLGDTPTLVFEDRDGELSGTARRTFVTQFYRGLGLVSHAASSVKESTAASHQPQGPGADTANLTVEMVTSGSSETPTSTILKLRLTRIEDVVTVLVPILCIQPVSMQETAGALDTISGISVVGQRTEQREEAVKKFEAFISLRTSAYEREVGPVADNDARPLSRSLLAERRLRVINKRDEAYANTPQWAKLLEHEKESLVMGAEKSLREIDGEMKASWVVEERAIRVKRSRYVIAVGLISGILVVGGILTGVLLGKRLDGVDPFNITVFAWVLAGFVILVAKSLLVADWPWKDFLQGVVPCRSVSELHRVTGIGTQDILAHLLCDETSTILVTKGPYNRPFARQGDDGFSIDEKVQLRTLMASGILGVKVATASGPALVFMDLRNRLPGRASLGHSGSVGKDEVILGCTQGLEVFQDEKGIPLVLYQQLRWIRILGLYHKANREFR